MDNSFRPDLNAYFARIGHDGPREPALRTLNRIIAAHTSSIPFENLDVLLGKPVSVRPKDIERKLVHDRRGGYCFEQNGLMLHVLRELGYQVAPISARVRFQKPRDITPARTHMFLRVELNGQSWLVDVGVGGFTLTCALPLLLNTPQQTPHDTRRFVATGDWTGFSERAPDALLYHQVLIDDSWEDIYEFTLEEMPMVDREVGNWYTSMHPTSHFRSQLMVAMAADDSRISLLNYEFKHRRIGGDTVVTTVASNSEILELLRARFGIDLPAGTKFSIPAA